MAAEGYQVLARKWRPQTFDDVVGQEHITRTLKNAIGAGRIGHAFLFIGSRGIGKTTTARILSKALNCLSVDTPTPEPCGTCNNCLTIASGTNIDVMEIDGASNNKVEHVREIREQIRLVPSHSRYKVYIIDEVHQLSVSAFNALLKTLEEPPPHAIFVLATTEAHKIPATIISRCQRFDFRRVSISSIITLLRRILDAEEVRCSDEALHAIARTAEGGIRDAESILDQLMSYCGDTISFQDVYDVLGLIDWRMLNDLCDAIVDKNIARQLEIVEDVVAVGKDLSQFVQEILQYLRNLLVCKTGADDSLLGLPPDEAAEIRVRADRFTLTELIRLVEQFAEMTKGFDSQLAQRISLESLLIRISEVAVEVSVDSVMEKLLALERGGAGETPKKKLTPAPTTGEPTAPAQVTAPTPESGVLREEAPTLNTPQASAEPEEAGPPEDSAPVGPVEMTADNLESLWARVMADVTRDDLNRRVWLSQGVPCGTDGDCLLLTFPNQQAAAIAGAAEHRDEVERALAHFTTNITHVRCLASEANDEGDAVESAENRPWSAGVSTEQAKEALEDSHIAAVVEVFRGCIVQVKSHGA